MGGMGWMRRSGLGVAIAVAISAAVSAQAVTVKARLSPVPGVVQLVRRRAQVLGVIFPSLRQTFWAAIVLGIEQVAKANGYTVLFAHSNDRVDANTQGSQ